MAYTMELTPTLGGKKGRLFHLLMIQIGAVVAVWDIVDVLGPPLQGGDPRVAWCRRREA